MYNNNVPNVVVLHEADVNTVVTYQNDCILLALFYKQVENDCFLFTLPDANTSDSLGEIKSTAAVLTCM